MWFCFRTVAGLAAVAASLAAGSPSAGRVTLVVRPDSRSGKLVRAAVVAPRLVASPVIAPKPAEVPAPAAAAKPAPPANLREAIDQIAAEHALPAGLVHSVIKVESNYNAHAISPKGALGMMQLIPSTARRFGVSNAFNPVENIKGGTRYLRYLLNMFNGNTALALAAYNAGEHNVLRYGGVPPFSETRNYLIQVKRRLEELSRSSRPAQAAASDPQHETREVKPVQVQNRIHEITDASGKVYYVSRQD
ncbi:MAG: lytic transglycosylase domain-containing protein [Bryobacteraceae bacterium]